MAPCETLKEQVYYSYLQRCHVDSINTLIINEFQNVFNQIAVSLLTPDSGPSYVVSLGRNSHVTFMYVMNTPTASRVYLIYY